MKITKENFNKHDPRCRAINLDGKLYMAYEEGGVFHIIGEYTRFKAGRVFFFHRYKGEDNVSVGELKDLRGILRENSVLVPATWDGYKWVPGISNELLLPKKNWSFLRQCWISF